MEKLQRIRLSQFKTDKKYYEKNKKTEKKKQTYIELKQQSNFSEIQRQRAKDYIEKHKELIRKKNLDRYHNTKKKLEFPEILQKPLKLFIIFKLLIMFNKYLKK